MARLLDRRAARYRRRRRCVPSHMFGMCSLVLTHHAPSTSLPAGSAPAIIDRLAAEAEAQEQAQQQARAAAQAQQAPAAGAATAGAVAFGGAFTVERLQHVRYDVMAQVIAEPSCWADAAAAAPGVPEDATAALALADAVLAPVAELSALRHRRIVDAAVAEAMEAATRAAMAMSAASAAAAATPIARAAEALAAANDAADAAAEAEAAGARAARYAHDASTVANVLPAATSAVATAITARNAAAASAAAAAAAAAAAPPEVQAVSLANAHAAAEAATHAMFLRESRPCPTPGCGRALIKEEGDCNSLSPCPLCGVASCWSCLQPAHEHSYGPCSRSGPREAVRAAIRAAQPQLTPEQVAEHEAAMAAADLRRREERRNGAAEHARMHREARDRRRRDRNRGWQLWREDHHGARVNGLELAMAPVAAAAAAVRVAVSFRAAAGENNAATAAADAAVAQALPPLRALLGVTLAEVARVDETAEANRRRAEAEIAANRRRAEAERRRYAFTGRAERAAAMAAWEASWRATVAWFRASGGLDDAAPTPAEWAPRMERCATMLMQAAEAVRRREAAAAAAAGAAGPFATALAAALRVVAAAAGIEECALAAQMLHSLPAAAAAAEPQLPPHIHAQLQKLSHDAGALENVAAALRAEGDTRLRQREADLRLAERQRRRARQRFAEVGDDAGMQQFEAHAQAELLELVRMQDTTVTAAASGVMEAAHALRRDNAAALAALAATVAA